LVNLKAEIQSAEIRLG